MKEIQSFVETKIKTKDKVKDCFIFSFLSHSLFNEDEQTNKKKQHYVQNQNKLNEINCEICRKTYFCHKKTNKKKPQENKTEPFRPPLWLLAFSWDLWDGL
jgi:hypothetical protein